MTVTHVAPRSESAFALRLVQIGGFIFYLLAAQAMITAAVGVSVFWSTRSASDLLLPATSVLLAAAYVAIGYSLRRHRLWARNFAFAFATMSLFAFPFGTAVGLAIAGCVASGNRAGIFPSLRRSIPEAGPLLRFEPEFEFGPDLVPELVSERVG
jgi:chromate transport protein ChrA